MAQKKGKQSGKQGGGKENDDANGGSQEPKGGEFRGSDKMGAALISGATFTNKSVVYYEVEGMAIVEGDIAIGTVEEVTEFTEAAREAASGDPNIAFGVGITGSQFRWPDCVVPYEIDPNLPNAQRVTDAIAHWEENTNFRFPLRTAANQGQHPNWVRFTDAGGCWSMVGMQGGRQTISLSPGCSTGNAIHEIGHAIGLWHEQSREDRDLFVTINWQNIQDGMAAQFNQHIADGDDLGPYDYGSIMHYPRTAFTKNGQETITPTDPNAQIGQRDGLSANDIAAVAEMYPGCGVVKQPWRDPGTFKKLMDDPRPKPIWDPKPPRDPKPIWDPKPPRDPKPIWDPKPIRDPKGPRDPKGVLDPKGPRDPKGVLDPKGPRDPKGVLDPKGPRDPKGVLDPKGPRDPGPIKQSYDPMPGRPQVVVRPGLVVGRQGLKPFNIATPHHAPGQYDMGAEASAAEAYMSELEQELLDLEAAIAHAQAAAAQANADAARLQQQSAALAAAYGDAAAQLGGGG